MFDMKKQKTKILLFIGTFRNSKVLIQVEQYSRISLNCYFLLLLLIIFQNNLA